MPERLILAALVCNKLKAGQWICWFIQLSVWMCGCVCVNVCIYIRSLQLVPCCLLVLIKREQNAGKKSYVTAGVGVLLQNKLNKSFICLSLFFSVPVPTFPLFWHPRVLITQFLISLSCLTKCLQKLFGKEVRGDLGYNSFNMSYKFKFSEGQTSVSFLQCKNLFLIIH